jgi:hypothetical protein
MESNGGDCSITCFCKAGSYSKPLKNCAQTLNMDDKPKMNFWKDQHEAWSHFRQFNLQLLAAADILDSLLMRLTFFFDNIGFQKLLDEDYVTFSPFSGVPKHSGKFRMTTLSYQALVWTLYKLEENCELQENCELHRAWCLYAMDYVEQAYIDDLIAIGYIPVPSTKGSIEEHFVKD